MPYITRPAISLAIIAALVACGHNSPGDTPATAFSNTSDNFEPPALLAINGFNYSDLVIEFFTVAGQGGGNIAVSSPTSGGGGTVCCLVWRSTIKLPVPVEVKWMRYVDKKPRWCKKTIMFSGPVPAKPSNIGIHFMPDGNIEIAITQGTALPRMSLQRFSPAARKEYGNNIYDETSANCIDAE